MCSSAAAGEARRFLALARWKNNGKFFNVVVVDAGAPSFFPLLLNPPNIRLPSSERMNALSPPGVVCMCGRYGFRKSVCISFHFLFLFPSDFDGLSPVLLAQGRPKGRVRHFGKLKNRMGRVPYDKAMYLDGWKDNPSHNIILEDGLFTASIRGVGGVRLLCLKG